MVKTIVRILCLTTTDWRTFCHLSAISYIYTVFLHDVKAAILVSQNNDTAMLVSQQPVLLVDAVVIKEFWKMGSVILFHGIEV